MEKFEVKNYRSYENLQKGINEMFGLGYKPILLSKTKLGPTAPEDILVVFEYGVDEDEMIQVKKEAIHFSDSSPN